MHQICILRSLHFSSLIFRISSGFGGRWWHDSLNEQDASGTIYGRAQISEPGWRPGRSEMPEMLDTAEFTVGVTRDQPNCGQVQKVLTSCKFDQINTCSHLPANNFQDLHHNICNIRGIS